MCEFVDTRAFGCFGRRLSRRSFVSVRALTDLNGGRLKSKRQIIIVCCNSIEYVLGVGDLCVVCYVRF